MFRWTLFFGAVQNLLLLSAGFGMLGPADYIFKTVEECEEPVHIVELSAGSHKHNRSVTVMDITVRTPFEINNDVILELKGSLKKEGGYKPGSFYLKDQLCTCLETYLGTIFHDILNSAGLDSCLVPAGEYYARDFYFDNSKFKVPTIYGEYKMQGLLWMDNKVQSCYNVYYEFTPKTK